MERLVSTPYLVPSEQESAICIDGAPIGAGIKALQLALGMYKEVEGEDNLRASER